MLICHLTELLFGTQIVSSLVEVELKYIYRGRANESVFFQCKAHATFLDCPHYFDAWRRIMYFHFYRTELVLQKNNLLALFCCHGLIKAPFFFI